MMRSKVRQRLTALIEVENALLMEAASVAAMRVETAPSESTPWTTRVRVPAVVAAPSEADPLC